MLGGCCSVAWTVHSSDARFAAAVRLAGNDGQFSTTWMSDMRCGSSAKLQCTSIDKSSTERSACVAQEYSTENVQLASPLASIWNGEYCTSGDGASTVSGPAVGSRRMASSESRVIFMRGKGARVRPVRCRVLGRLLLGQAVQRPEPPYQVHRV